MQDSKIGFQKWAFCLYLTTTSPKGVSSMKIYREVGVTQKTAWHLMHRIREAFASDSDPRLRFPGPVEIDEAYFGGKESNKHKHKKLNAGRGTVGKQAVVSIRDRDTKEVRARLVPDTKADTLQEEVARDVEPSAVKYTDEAAAYEGLENHRTVSHSTGQYVDGMAYVNGCESFLGYAEARIPRNLPPHELQALAAVRERIRRPPNIRDKDTVEQIVPSGPGIGRPPAPIPRPYGLIGQPPSVGSGGGSGLGCSSSDGSQAARPQPALDASQPARRGWQRSSSRASRSSIRSMRPFREMQLQHDQAPHNARAEPEFSAAAVHGTGGERCPGRRLHSGGQVPDGYC